MAAGRASAAGSAGRDASHARGPDGWTGKEKGAVVLAASTATGPRRSSWGWPGDFRRHVHLEVRLEVRLSPCGRSQ